MKSLKNKANKTTSIAIHTQYIRRSDYKELLTFNDKFIFGKTDSKFYPRFLELLDYLSNVHKKYSEYRYHVWEDFYGDTVMGNIMHTSININSKDKTPLQTLVHEIGHGLDITELAVSKKTVSILAKEYSVLTKKLAKSKMALNIKRELKRTDTDESTKELLKYYLNPVEMFARCYQYYIYMKLRKHSKGLYNPRFKVTKFSKIADLYCDEYYEILETADTNLVNVYWDQDHFDSVAIYESMDNLIKKINKFGIDSKVEIVFFDEIISEM